MSAWIVADRDIDVLVTAAIDLGVSYAGTVVTQSTANDVGLQLKIMNYHSVNYRYSGSEQPTNYLFKRYVTNPAEVEKTINFYNYQSCEDEVKYIKSPQYTFINDLAKQNHAENFDKISQEDFLNLYESAPWGHYESA